MKTITETFYVSSTYIESIKKAEDSFLSPVKVGLNQIEIQISWQESEREITLTESQLEAKLARIAVKPYADGVFGKNVFTIGGIKQDLCGVEDLKNELFGASDE